MKSINGTTVVLGGGLAGLTAATFLARGGRSVRLIERASSLGGRGVTHRKNGFHCNLGAHALYRAGRAREILGELGIPYSGHTPKVQGGFGLDRDQFYTFPAGMISLMTTSMVPLGSKFELAKLLATLGRVDFQSLMSTPLSVWLKSQNFTAETARFVEAIVRVSCYLNCPERASAGAVLQQMWMAVDKNVLYLDEGWQVLVDGLATAARESGVQIDEGTAVANLSYDGDYIDAVELTSGERIACNEIVIATGPSAARTILGERGKAIELPTPVRAACLDVSLSSMPRPKVRFVLGIDQPLYYSVHSESAQLAPKGGALIHLMKYLDPDDTDSRLAERELEALLDRAQPGWRDVLVERTFLPSMVVTNALVTAEAGGLAGRASVEVPGVKNAFFAGDWVGNEGMLSDASFASARSAAMKILSTKVSGGSVSRAA